MKILCKSPCERPERLFAGIIGLQSLFKKENRPLKIFFLKDICDSHLVLSKTRRRVEAAGRSHHHSLSLIAEIAETPCAEVLRILNRKLCNGIEGSHRNRRIYSRDLVETVYKTLSAGYIFLVYIS